MVVGMAMVRRRCGGFSSRDGTVHMLDDGAAFACCWRAAASRAQWDAEHVTVQRSFIRETLALVDALEDDYPGSLSSTALPPVAPTPAQSPGSLGDLYIAPLRRFSQAKKKLHPN